MKKAKLYTLSKVFTKDEKKNPPSHIKIDGHIYERLEVKTVELSVELAGDVLDIVKDKVASGGYVNSAEVIREAIRHAINESDLKGSSTK